MPNASAYRLYSYIGEPVVLPNGVGPSPLFTIPLPANTLAEDGSMIQIMCFGWMADDDVVKSINVHLGDSSISALALDADHDGWMQESWIVRKNQTGAVIRQKIGFTTCYDLGSATATMGLLHFGSRVPEIITTVDWTQDTSITILGQSATAEDAAITGIGCVAVVWP